MSNPRRYPGEWLHLDLALLAWVIALCALGLCTLYSAADNSMAVVIKQGVRIGIGLFAMVAIAQVSPARWAAWAPLLYSVGVLLLVLVELVGTGRGAQRWLALGGLRFQPSEIMKLAVPLMVAAQIAHQPLPPNLRQIGLCALIILVPCGLIANQPDLGTSLLVGASGLFVLFVAGMSWRLLAGLGLVGLVSAPLAWMFLHDYQRQRVLTLFDPQSDPLGAGYHIIQSTIAVGSGGLLGKGWLNGTQSHLEFIPERATDFIFAVFCEEFGFLGVLVLLAGYAGIIVRGLIIADDAQSVFGKLLATSLTLTFFIYIFVNMSMVIGQLPVVGVPLPLVSYGGTSLVTLMAAFGMLMSVRTHRRLISDF